jgi:hypothetical protein
MAATAKKAGTRANSQKKRPPELFEEKPKEVNLLEGLPTPEDVQAKQSPYPEGVHVFSYQPKDGSEPILLALDGFEVPDKLWHFDMAQLPILSQTWAWMRKANIPKEIQRRAQMLPDPEYFDMFDEWFEVMKQMRGGGPKGAVTAGK